jgi:hypothetical protein
MNAIVDASPAGQGPVTADVAAAAALATTHREVNGEGDTRVAGLHSEGDKAEERQLALLFEPAVAADFRSRWNAVQSSFVDDPREAVRRGDELVIQVMKSLADTFSAGRDNLAAELDQTDEASTETLRVALRRYRSFFERLLSL